MNLGKDPIKIISVFSDLWFLLTKLRISSADQDHWRELKLAQRIIDNIEGGVYNEKDI
jgi:hypothetical protein